jgi:hypothetical protein
MYIFVNALVVVVIVIIICMRKASRLFCLSVFFLNKFNHTDLHCYTFEPVKTAYRCEKSFYVHWIAVLILR